MEWITTAGGRRIPVLELEGEREYPWRSLVVCGSEPEEPGSYALEAIYPNEDEMMRALSSYRRKDDLLLAFGSGPDEDVCAIYRRTSGSREESPARTSHG
jgi:hypothetical protein